MIALALHETASVKRDSGGDALQRFEPRWRAEICFLHVWSVEPLDAFASLFFKIYLFIFHSEIAQIGNNRNFAQL